MFGSIHSNFSIFEFVVFKSEHKYLKLTGGVVEGEHGERRSPNIFFLGGDGVPSKYLGDGVLQMISGQGGTVIQHEIREVDSQKIIEIVATRCDILKLKCTKLDFGWGSAQDFAGGTYSAPPSP